MPKPPTSTVWLRIPIQHSTLKQIWDWSFGTNILLIPRDFFLVFMWKTAGRMRVFLKNKWAYPFIPGKSVALQWFASLTNKYFSRNPSHQIEISQITKNLWSNGYCSPLTFREISCHESKWKISIGKNKNTRTVLAESSRFASVLFDHGFQIWVGWNWSEHHLTVFCIDLIVPGFVM